jgi:hypothetical protein
MTEIAYAINKLNVKAREPECERAALVLQNGDIITVEILDGDDYGYRVRHVRALIGRPFAVVSSKPPYRVSWSNEAFVFADDLYEDDEPRDQTEADLLADYDDELNTRLSLIAGMRS